MADGPVSQRRCRCSWHAWTRTAAGRRTWRLRHEKRCGREKRRTPPPAARQARSVPGPPPTPSRAERQRWPHPRFESGWPPWVHTACGTPVVRSRPIPAPYASWRSLSRYQPVVVPFIPPPLSGHRATAPADRVSNAHDHGSQGGKSSLTTAPTHVLQTSPASDGPAHFPHPGHPWPASDGNQECEATNDTQPPDPQTYSRRHSPDKPGCTLQPWNPEAINPGAPYMT